MKQDNIKKEICPVCLEKLQGKDHTNCFPKGIILIKRKEYCLLKITTDEPISKRMRSICKDKENNSKEYILLYVNKKLFGYKGKNEIKFIPWCTEEKYKKMLREYVPRSQRKRNTYESPMWHSNEFFHQSNIIIN